MLFFFFVHITYPNLKTQEYSVVTSVNITPDRLSGDKLNFIHHIIFFERNQDIRVCVALKTS